MEKIKVKATDKYEKLKVKDSELNRIPKNGEEFEVSKERYEVLTKTNKYNVVFVKKVEETKETGKSIKTTNKKKGTSKNEKENRR